MIEDEKTMETSLETTKTKGEFWFASNSRAREIMYAEGLVYSEDGTCHDRKLRRRIRLAMLRRWWWCYPVTQAKGADVSLLILADDRKDVLEEQLNRINCTEDYEVVSGP